MVNDMKNSHNNDMKKSHNNLKSFIKNESIELEYRPIGFGGFFFFFNYKRRS